MINVLKDLASSLTAVREFRKDPDAFLDRYPTLSAEERSLLLEGDSRKVSGYVSGKVNADTTIVVIVLAPSVSNEMTCASRQSSHRNFWDHVSQRSQVLAA
ncbi:MAG: hypothetical protein RIG84_06425 [Roseovarius sp.]